MEYNELVRHAELYYRLNKIRKAYMEEKKALEKEYKNDPKLKMIRAVSLVALIMIFCLIFVVAFNLPPDFSKEAYEKFGDSGVMMTKIIFCGGIASIFSFIAQCSAQV